MKHSMYKNRHFLWAVWIILIGMIGTASCSLNEPGVEPPNRAIYFPIGLALHPDGRYAVVVNANFNLSYRNGTLSIIDLSQLPVDGMEAGADRIVKEWTRTIGTFGGMARFNANGTRLYVTVRGERKEFDSITGIPGDSLYIYDVNPDAVPGEEQFLNNMRHISLAADPFGMAMDADGRFLYVSHLSNGEVSIVQTEPGVPTNPVLRDRFYNGPGDDGEGDALYNNSWCLPRQWSCSGVDCIACNRPADCTGTECLQCPGDSICLESIHEADTFFCSQPCTSDSQCGAGFICTPLRATSEVAERKFEAGGNSIAIHPTTGSVYIAAKFSNKIGVIRPFYREGVVIETLTELFTAADGEDIRGMQFYIAEEREGGGPEVLLYAASRNNNLYPGLAVIDVSENPEDYSARLKHGLEYNRQIDFISTCSGPASTARAGKLLFVACYSSDIIEVYDVESGMLVDQIIVAVDNKNIAMAPYDLLVIPDAAGESAGVMNVKLMISLFSGHEVQLWNVSYPHGNKEPHSLLLRVHNHAIAY